ncbi:hypothetical protein ACP275_09G023800 [Erythranthe tilingii]
MQASSLISLSPSFNSYSNTEIAAIAARVVDEFASEEFYDEFYFDRGGEIPSAGEDENSDSVEHEEFEFAFATTRDSDLSSSPVSADEIFHNGQIRPVYPVLNRNLFIEFQNGSEKVNGVRDSGPEKVPTIRLPLRKLFIAERESTMTTTSSSSSEVDDLDGVPAETYCVWRPKEAAAAEELRKKSSSAGSNSKRWKFKDLLYRSHSDGIKDSFVFLSPSNSGRKKENEDRGGKVKPAAAPPPSPPLYSRDVVGKRRSYLPYKQDLVGFFSNVNVNGFSKNLQPF